MTEILEQGDIFPEMQVPGFPGPEEGPRSPDALRAKFGDRRWIEVDDPARLDYEGAEILLLGAHAHDVREQLGTDIDMEADTADSAEVFRTLRLERAAGHAPLFRGKFPAEELLADAARRVPEDSPILALIRALPAPRYGTPLTSPAPSARSSARRAARPSRRRRAA